MAPNLTAIASEFEFNDEERDRKLGGEISLAFFVVGGTASMAIALLIDKADRRKLFALTVLLGEVRYVVFCLLDRSLTKWRGLLHECDGEGGLNLCLWRWL